MRCVLTLLHREVPKTVTRRSARLDMLTENLHDLDESLTELSGCTDFRKDHGDGIDHRAGEFLCLCD